MKIKIEAEVSDNFEKGDCDECPFSYYDYDEYIDYCILHKRYDECPIIMEEIEDE